jgi:hypothetical protein
VAINVDLVAVAQVVLGLLLLVALDQIVILVLVMVELVDHIQSAELAHFTQVAVVDLDTTGRQVVDQIKLLV